VIREVVTGDGVTLRAADSGPAPGATVVLLAGYTAPATSWALQVDALVAAGHRAVCLDRRSHGLSDAPAHGQRMSRHGKDLHDARAGLDLGDVVLVGGSMGASTVWAHLDQFGTGAVRGVVSVDQTPKMINDAGWPHGFYGLTDANSGVLFAEGVPPTGRGAPVDTAALARLVERAGPDSLPGTLRPETLPLLRDHAQQDWRDVVTRTDVPVLMVAARDSQFWPCAHAAAAVEDNPHGRAVVLDDCGHAANLDQPDAFNTELLTFLRDL
jgi:non-heme chloroperoxidase